MDIIDHKRDALSYHDKVFNELYFTNALVNATLTCCKEKEFKGQYYGIPKNFIPLISEERNEFISLLTIISDRLKYMNKLHLGLEEKLSNL